MQSLFLREFQMTVWNVESVNGEPEIVLVRWRVMETGTCERHLVGVRDDFTGRVSTAITTFDPLRMVATTESGRIYQLRGAPGDNADAQYVWEQWCLVNGVRKFNDVTDTVYKAPKNIS
jgi:hypothetical protein